MSFQAGITKWPRRCSPRNIISIIILVGTRQPIIQENIHRVKKDYYQNCLRMDSVEKDVTRAHPFKLEGGGVKEVSNWGRGSLFRDGLDV